MRIPLAILIGRSLGACAQAENLGQGQVPEQSAPLAVEQPAPQPASTSPLAGTWRVERVGDAVFPDPPSGLFPNVRFEENGFLSHWAGCGGSFPAFYKVDGPDLAITRREEVIIGKCESAADAARERALATALDSAKSWSIEGPRLILSGAEGTRIVLSRPTEPIPALAGRWIVLTIDGKALGSERSPAVSLSRGHLGAAADCNALSTQYSADAAGSFRVTGGLIATQMGCPAPDMAEDSRLFGALGAVTGWSVDGAGRLILSGPRPLVLRRPEPGDTAGRLPAS